MEDLLSIAIGSASASGGAPATLGLNASAFEASSLGAWAYAVVISTLFAAADRRRRAARLVAEDRHPTHPQNHGDTRGTLEVLVPDDHPRRHSFYRLMARLRYIPRGWRASTNPASFLPNNHHTTPPT